MCASMWSVHTCESVCKCMCVHMCACMHMCVLVHVCGLSQRALLFLGLALGRRVMQSKEDRHSTQDDSPQTFSRSEALFIQTVALRAKTMQPKGRT